MARSEAGESGIGGGTRGVTNFGWLAERLKAPHC